MWDEMWEVSRLKMAKKISRQENWGLSEPTFPPTYLCSDAVAHLLFSLSSSAVWSGSVWGLCSPECQFCILCCFRSWTEWQMGWRLELCFPARSVRGSLCSRAMHTTVQGTLLPGLSVWLKHKLPAGKTG